MFQIINFSLSKLNNAEYVAYCVNLANLIERAEANTLGLEPNLVTNFTNVKQKLIDQVYTNQTSPYTATMRAADAKRGKIYRRIQLKMQIVCQAEDGSSLLQFKDELEDIIMPKYTMAVITLPQQEESAVLQGFIHDMNATFSEDDLDDMDLATDLTNLESANQEFISAYANRSDERATSDTGVTVKLRAQMNEVVSQLYFALQYMANSTLESNASKATACQTFVGALNVMLADTKKRWHQRTSGLLEEDVNGAGTNGTAGAGGTSGGNTDAGGNANPSGGNGDTGANAGTGGNSNPSGGTGADGGTGGNTNPSGGNTDAGGSSNPSGSNTGGNTNPSGTDTGSNTNPSGTNTDTGGTNTDRENGTLNGGTVEF